MINTKNQQNEDIRYQQNRSIRVFVSSTFRDMMGERDALMTHTWPQLRRFCRELHVELVEVDLRWGIAEEQSTRKETLKLCLDEIRACRPFFIGLLGERYGWIPDDDAYTADLEEEQSWIKELHGRSVTELEILHGVLRNPEMAGRAFFYFRDPEYALNQGADFLPENETAAAKQNELKNHIRKTCEDKNIPLEDYPDPEALAVLVLEQLKAAIAVQFPKENIPDPLDKETLDHEVFAETRRRTYISRSNYFNTLDSYITGEGTPFVLSGDSGSGKSALLANWVTHWINDHPDDFIFQHYIGGTTDSAIHWKLMTRLMAEIKRWTNDPEELPGSNDDILRDFPLWLSKARIKAEREGVRFVVVLDALNQLEDKDHGRLLGWLPEHPFTGALKLITSTLSGETQEVLEKWKWQTLSIKPLTYDERSKMIVDYLGRFSKKLDVPRLERLSAASAAANPLYLKILLDELRVTGTYDKLDERLDDYLSASDIPSLLGKVLARYQRDYEHDRKGLVKDALDLIWSARRGLTEVELMELLKPDNLHKLPLATWAPLRAALEEGLVDRGGILNFSHDFLRAAVETAFLPDIDTKNDFRIALANYFEAQSPNRRNCDELPWLLWQTELSERLRKCLLNIDSFIELRERDEDELRGYWVYLNEERSMGKHYLDSFNSWAAQKGTSKQRTSFVANQLGFFLFNASLYTEAEPLLKRAFQIGEHNFRKNDPEVAIRLNNLSVLFQATNRFGEAEPLIKRALQIDEQNLGKEHPNVARDLNNLAQLLQDTNRLDEAEPLIRRALQIDEQNFGKDHPFVAIRLINLAGLLKATNRYGEAEPLLKRALQIDEQSFGKKHPNVARDLGSLALLFKATNRYCEAEPLLKRALQIDEQSFGKDHPNVARDINNLALLLQATNRYCEAEPLMKRALQIDEQSFGKEHPKVATSLNNLALLLQDTNRYGEAEPLMKRALQIDEQSFGKDHPKVATSLNNLALLLQETNRYGEAEPLMKRALQIDEQSFGKDHPNVAIRLNNLAQLLKATNRLDEAEPLMKRVINIFEKSLGKNHPNVATSLNNLALLLQDTNRYGEAEPLMKRALQIDEQSLGKDHPKVAISLNNLALLLQATNRLGEAEPLMKRVIKIYEKSLGKNHPKVALGLSNLAQLLLATNRYGEAEPLMMKALQIDEQSFGKDHPNVAVRLNNLAQLLQATNRLDEAEPLMKRVINIFEKSLGKNHPNVATSLSNLAGLFQASNRYGEAETLLERALQIDEQSLGKDHPKVAIRLNNLAQLLQETNRLGEAEPLMKRVINIFEKSLGKNHPNMATSLNNLARLFLATNRYGEAEPLLRRALQIDEQSLGNDHPDVARDIRSLAGLLRSTNRFGEAEPLMKRAIQIDEQSFGKDHPKVARDIRSLARVLQATSRLGEAELLYERALQIDEQSFGKDHPNVATSLNNLALLLQATNRLGEAEPLSRRVVEIFINFTRSTSNQHPHLQKGINNYKNLLEAMGWSQDEIIDQLKKIAPELFNK
ncbi:MAG: tetratricopeptide repeat protein [Candidatus Cloacimonetes bacterium]|nr:tetratricopeptide repeat protein [Candidatus Cloacimonadota bacterium]